MEQQDNEKVKGVADIVFLLDVTGSMKPCIDALKANIGTFVQSLSAPADANSGPPIKDWRIKVAGYRDVIADGSNWWVENPFVTDIGQVALHLGCLKAEGGKDEPESLLDGLYKFAKMPSTEKGAPPDPNMWRHRYSAARAVIFFSDATYHPSMSIPEAAGGTVDEVIRELQASGIILCGYAPKHPCYETLAELDKAVLEYVGNDLKNAVEAMATYTSNKGNFEEVLRALAKTVSMAAQVEPV